MRAPLLGLSIAATLLSAGTSAPADEPEPAPARTPTSFAVGVGVQARALWGVPIVGPEAALTFRPSPGDIGAFVTGAFAYGRTEAGRPVLLPRASAGPEWRPAEFLRLGFGGRLAYAFLKRGTASGSYIYAPCLGVEAELALDVVSFSDDSRLYFAATPFVETSIQATDYAGADHGLLVPMYGGSAVLGIRWDAAEDAEKRAEPPPQGSR